MAKTKSIATKKEKQQIKYSDKGGGQPELVPIFEEIKKRLLPYEKGAIKARGNTGGQITLVSEIEIEVEGRKKEEVWFAAALIQKGYVGFYFMPIYIETEMKKIFKPELLKCLKGKSCFHIKKNDAVIMQQIEDALQAGYELYRQKGWV